MSGGLEGWRVDDPLSPFVGEVVVCRDDVAALIADNAIAMTYQTMRQYREALLQMLRAIEPAAGA